MKIKIREFIIYIDNHLDNFPKKDIELKNKIRNKSYDLLELVYKANVTSNQVYKKSLLEEIIANIKVIDFLLNLCYEKEIINGKRYVKFGEKTDNANFGPGEVNTEDGLTNAIGANNYFNSNGNENEDGLSVRPL